MHARMHVCTTMVAVHMADRMLQGWNRICDGTERNPAAEPVHGSAGPAQLQARRTRARCRPASHCSVLKENPNERRDTVVIVMRFRLKTLQFHTNHTNRYTNRCTNCCDLHTNHTHR